jgi:predicted Zn-dependent protease
MTKLINRLMSGGTMFAFGNRVQGRSGSGCNPRLIMAGLMILEYENPFTGRKQRLAMPTAEQEIAMGMQSAPQMIREMGGAHPDPAANALLDRVGAKLVNTTGVKETPYKFDFHLLADDQTVNAFALPGGQIFITSALFRLLQNEDQLAGVLGHEIGHVVGRHSNQQMAKSQLLNGLAQGAGVLLSDGQSMGGMQMAQMLGQMVNMKYGREDELESDMLGVKFLLQAGYDPEALIGVMEILAKAGGGKGQPEIMSTHPAPENRIEFIREQIAKMQGERPAR